MKINLVMIVKNEERFLEKCLSHVKPLVDEMIIADTGSTDRTKEIACRMGARVLDYRWTGDFSAARNFALKHSDADWNLVLDADEYLYPCRRGELEERIHACSERYPAWIGSLLRHDFWNGENGVEESLTWLPRLLPKGTGYFGLIHEQPEEIGPFFELPLEAKHEGYLYEDKGRRNLEYLQKATKDAPEDMYYRFQMAMTLRNMQEKEESLPHFRTFYQHAPRQSGYWTEGVILYLYTLMDLGESYLAEAFDVIKTEEPAMGGLADFQFVCGLFYMKLVLSDVAANIQYLPRIEESFLRCLRIGESGLQSGVVGTGSFKAAYNLGLWYEVSGQVEKAVRYYKESAQAGFQPAKERLKNLSV